MLEQYFRSAHVLARIRKNPCREHIERLVEHLHCRGHKQTTIQQYVQAAEHFGKWAGKNRRRQPVVDKETISTFIQRHLPNCKCAAPAGRYVNTARAALRHLVRAAAPPVGTNSAAITPGERLIREYIKHLELNGGLARGTRCYRARYAREFLEDLALHGNIRLNHVRPQDVMRFVTGYTGRCKRSSAQVAACSLRNFLRFLHRRGLCGGYLVRAVPRIAQWRRENLPKIMTEKQLSHFLAAFDRAEATGRRDYAMALYMVDLGLRVSEVVTLNLDDIDWRNGTVRIASAKGRRSRLLPLSNCVGRATASYLHGGRPSSKECRLFLRQSVTVGTPVSRDLVRGVVRRAYARADCPRHWTGTHILRHTAATRLLQRGANLKEIADLLGHQSIDTAAIYAKVNLPSLASVALPWPEVEA